MSTCCQRLDLIGAHTLFQRLQGRIDDGLGIKSGLVRLVRPPKPSAHLGKASRFATGQWVRVHGRDAVRATLDATLRLRGLYFVPEQWNYCDGVFQVEEVVRRIVDDRGRFRAVSGTVLLAGVDCGGPSGTAGCGRRCPLMFRDEWLAPASVLDAPRSWPPPTDAAWMRVRSVEAIRATLDWRGKRDGLGFMPEMAVWSGRRLRVLRRVERVYEHDRYTAPPRAVYVLDGPRCTGAVYAERGPCQRRCAILWHADWVEPA